MGSSSLYQWEADPLFSAAEVVQDSADRMESLFRLLLHEQSLSHGDHPDPRLLTLIEYHKRDLATILETTKWQLEDFERAVSSSALMDKTRQDVISRHRQFIIAIREHINHVEKRVDGSSIGDSLRKSERSDLDKRERGVLTSFTRGSAPEQQDHCDAEDSNILRRFLDPSSASVVKDSEIIECDVGVSDEVRINGDTHVENNLNQLQESSSKKMGSHYSTRLGLDLNSVHSGISDKRNVHNHLWDLEANEATPKIHDKKLRLPYSRMKLSGLLSNLWTRYGRGVTGNYTKRLKDGEDQNHSRESVDAFGLQGWHLGQMLGGTGNRSLNSLCLDRDLGARCKRFPCPLQVNRQLMQATFATIVTLILLCTLLYKII